MRIAIDYTSAIAQQAGIGRYTRSLVAALATLPTEDQFILFSAERPVAERGFAVGRSMRPRLVPVGNRALTILWHRLRVPLPIETFTGPVHVLHAPDFSMPPALAARRVVTIHDLAFLTHPECALPSLVEYLSAVVPRAARAADAVITVSQAAAESVVERLGVTRERVHVIPLGVAPGLAPVHSAERRAELDARLGLVHPLVLAVGTLEPRKNYERLVKAFALARERPGGPRMLALAGRRGWLYEPVFAAIERHGLAEHVRLLDFVAEDDLATLYSTAEVVAVPSLTEGFGIPVIEAMACGTPVVCSTGGALPEVAGDAALLVDPLMVEALAEALLRLTTDDPLRADLRHRGEARARGYTWEAAARAHLTVYHAVGGNGGR